MSEIPPIFVAASKPAMRLIAVLKGDVNSQVVLIPHDSQITRPAQLKGKKVGYVRATTAHYLLLKLLEENGLGFADIAPVALSPQDGRAAFERGSLDAWVSYGVQATAVRATVGARVLTTGLGRLSGDYLYAASPSALNDPLRRAAIADYLGPAFREPIVGATLTRRNGPISPRRRPGRPRRSTTSNDASGARRPPSRPSTPPPSPPNRRSRTASPRPA
jgi:hypothetical protein